MLEAGTIITDLRDCSIGEVREINLMGDRDSSLPADPIVSVEWTGDWERTETYWLTQFRWSEEFDCWSVFDHGIGAHHLVALGF